MNYKISFLFLGMLVFAFSIQTQAQDLLSLEQAVTIALENNYDIKLQSNNLELNQNNVSLGNAGFLPSINANMQNNTSIQDSKQKINSTGQIQERNNAKNSNLNYGVGLSWTIFDGLGMFIRYDQLKELEKLSEQNLQNEILTKISDVISVYYDLVQQQQQLQARDTAMTLSNYRVQITKNKFEIGKASGLEVLNARVDYNTDTTNLLKQVELYNNTRIRLNELLARNVTITFKVIGNITLDKSLLYDQLLEQAKKQNPTVQSALIGKRIASLNERQVKSDRYPTVALNSGYSFSNARSALGFASQTTGRGFVYGVSASVNIFNGSNQRRNEKNAKILTSNSELEYEKQVQFIESQLTTAYQTYQTSLSLVTLEEENIKIASQNLDISMEKYKLGRITPIEIREAQLNYTNALLRYTNSQYEAKLAEIFLKELSATLIMK